MIIANDSSKFSQYKLIRLLKTLSKDEYLRFGKFLKSPFFNYTPSLIKFYEMLKRHHPNFDSPRLKIEKLWARVFPDKAFTEQRFRQLCSDLTKLVEKYLIQLELERPESKAQHLLIQSLGRRNEYDLFEKAIKARMSLLGKEKMQDVNWHKEQMELLEYHYFHPLHNKQVKKNDMLPNLMDSLDAYYLFQKMKVGIGLLNRQKALTKEYDIRYLSIFETEEEEHFLEENWLFQLYQVSFDLLQKGQEEDFFKIEQLLFEKFDDLKGDDRQLFFLQCFEFCD